MPSATSADVRTMVTIDTNRMPFSDAKNDRPSEDLISAASGWKNSMLRIAP